MILSQPCPIYNKLSTESHWDSVGCFIPASQPPPTYLPLLQAEPLFEASIHSETVAQGAPCPKSVASSRKTNHISTSLSIFNILLVYHIRKPLPSLLSPPSPSPPLLRHPPKPNKQWQPPEYKRIPPSPSSLPSSSSSPQPSPRPSTPTPPNGPTSAAKTKPPP